MLFCQMIETAQLYIEHLDHNQALIQIKFHREVSNFGVLALFDLQKRNTMLAIHLCGMSIYLIEQQGEISPSLGNNNQTKGNSFHTMHVCAKAGGEQVCPTDINSQWWGNKAFLREEADDILRFVCVSSYVLGNSAVTIILVRQHTIQSFQCTLLPSLICYIIQSECFPTKLVHISGLWCWSLTMLRLAQYIVVKPNLFFRC